jgi:hypothetical protein
MTAHNPWPAGKEPSVDELLSDPIVLALLRSDGLTRRNVEAVLMWVNHAMGAARAPPKPARHSPPRSDGAAVVRISADLDAKLVLTRAND